MQQQIEKTTFDFWGVPKNDLRVRFHSLSETESPKRQRVGNQSHWIKKWGPVGNYEKLAQQTGAALSKVGRAFQDARQNHGGGAAWPNGIFFTDSKHPSSFATYLAGAVHYATVYGKSPAPLALYPGVGDVPAPEMTTDKPRADLMRTLAAKFVPATPLEQGK